MVLRGRKSEKKVVTCWAVSNGITSPHFHFFYAPCSTAFGRLSRGLFFLSVVMEQTTVPRYHTLYASGSSLIRVVVLRICHWVILYERSLQSLVDDLYVSRLHLDRGLLQPGVRLLDHYHLTAWVRNINCTCPYFNYKDVSTCLLLPDRSLYGVALSKQPAP